VRQGLKEIGTIATAVAAVVTSVVALVRERPEPKAEKSYDELADKIVELQAAVKKQHEAQVELAGYLQGYLNSMRDVQDKLGATQTASSVTRRAATSRVQPPPVPSLPEPTAQPKLEAPAEPADLF
jgi:uncharacterized coiled-coil DUF342 family protein